MQELKNQIEEQFLNKEGFIKDNKIKLEEVSINYAKISMEIETKHLNPSGIVHGGIIFSLADTVMGIAARTNMTNVVTVNAQIDFLRPGKTKKLTATANNLRVGHSFAVYQAEITDDDNKLISTCTATFYFINKTEF